MNGRPLTPTAARNQTGSFPPKCDVRPRRTRTMSPKADRPLSGTKVDGPETLTLGRLPALPCRRDHPSVVHYEAAATFEPTLPRTPRLIAIVSRRIKARLRLIGAQDISLAWLTFQPRTHTRQRWPESDPAITPGRPTAAASSQKAIEASSFSIVVRVGCSRPAWACAVVKPAHVARVRVIRK